MSPLGLYVVALVLTAVGVWRTVHRGAKSESVER
jgi:uncharacterized membrane protein